MKTKRKYLKEEVYVAIAQDVRLRKQISMALNIKPKSVYISARRRSGMLCFPFIVELIATHLDKQVKEIIEF